MVSIRGLPSRDSGKTEGEMQTQADTDSIYGSQEGLHRGGDSSLTLTDKHKFAKQKKYARFVRAGGQ